MERKTAPKLTLTSASSGKPDNTDVTNFRNTLLAAALSMSWQLAIIVLLPVIGGYELDDHYKTTPLWTIVGFVIALIGVVTVILRTLKAFTPKDNNA